MLTEATAQGLVTYAADGQIEAGLAERWTVIDDGRSYIFRLREARWANGRQVRANDVAALLSMRLRGGRLPPALRREFAPIVAVRGMTNRVLEIQLSRPMPSLLDLLAQPEMGISRSGGWGPWRTRWVGRTAVLTPVPLIVGDTSDADSNPAEIPPAAILWANRDSHAIAQFLEDDADAVLGGRFDGWPLVEAANIPENAVLIDPVHGLFGFAVVTSQGVLADDLARDAVAMAIDRSRIVRALGSPPGWTAQISLRAPGGPIEPIYPAWSGFSADERRSRARAIIASWRARNGGDAPVIRIAVPRGPGGRMLYALIAADLSAAGMAPRRVGPTAPADLRLIDEVAPGNDPMWIVRRVDCNRGIQCDTGASRLIAAVDSAADPAERITRINSAEEAVVRHGAFIPIANPLRWSLTSNRTPGLRPNIRARHSLIHLAQSPD
jgi:peptide/nickel transport system substrate-binding protein